MKLKTYINNDGVRFTAPTLNKSGFDWLDVLFTINQVDATSDSVKTLKTMVAIVKAFKSDRYNEKLEALSIEPNAKNFNDVFGTDVSYKTSNKALKELLSQNVIIHLDKSYYRLTDEFKELLEHDFNNIVIEFNTDVPSDGDRLSAIDEAIKELQREARDIKTRLKNNVTSSLEEVEKVEEVEEVEKVVDTVKDVVTQETPKTKTKTKTKTKSTGGKSNIRVFTDEEKKEIYKLNTIDKQSQQVIAKQFGTSKKKINDIIKEMRKDV